MCDDFSCGDDDYGGGSGYEAPAQSTSSGVDLGLLATLSEADQARVLASADARTQGVPYREDSGLNQTNFFGQDYYVPEAINPNIPAFSVGSSGSFTPEGGWSSATAPAAIDYNVPASNFGDLSYLDQPASTPPTDTPSFDQATFDSASFAPSQPAFDAGAVQLPTSFEGGPTFSPGESDISNGFVPGYGITDSAGLQPSDSTTPPLDYQPSAYAGGPMPSESPLPPNATPTVGAAPPAFDWNTMNYGGGPAGASGAPDVAALNASPAATSFAPVPTTGPAPGGLSAAGGGGLGATAGGSSDLAALDPNNNIPQWSADGQRYLGTPETGAGSGGAPGLPGVGESNRSSSSSSGSGKGGESGWLDSLGVKNPVGTAIAAAGLGYSVLKGQQQAKALQGPTGQSPGANLADLAAPAMAQGQQLTTQGANAVQQGVDALHTAAAGNQQTGNTLVNRGQETVQNATTDLRTTAQPLSAASEALLTTGPQNVAGAAANDLAALAATPTTTASTLQGRGVGLTSYVGTGTLPPSLQAQLDQGKSDARAGLISKYASRGMPTDPARNSSLRMELQDLDRRTIAQGEQMAAQLATTGNTLTGTGLNATQVVGGLQTSRGGIGTQATGQGIQAGAAAGQLAGTAGQLGQGTTQAGITSNQLTGNQLQAANAAAGALVNSGVAQSGLAANSFTTLANLDAAQAERTQKAIAAMAAALSGSNTANAANNLARTV